MINADAAGCFDLREAAIACLVLCFEMCSRVCVYSNILAHAERGQGRGGWG